MANSIGEKELRKDWPVVSGLGANDKHEGRQSNLIPEKKSLVNRNWKKGL